MSSGLPPGRGVRIGEADLRFAADMLEIFSPCAAEKERRERDFALQCGHARRADFTKPEVFGRTMKLRRGRGLLAAVALALGAGTASQAAPDVELGRYLAAECLTCHRPGTSGGTIPNINGMAEDRFTVLLTAYRDKRLSNPVMQNVAGRLTDEEIAALAAYFASLKQP